MPQVSSNPLSKPVQEKVLNIFLETFTRLNNKTKAKQLLYDLLTPTERVMLSKRLSIAYLLEKGYPYRIISETLKVSLTTIARVNLSRHISGEGYRQILQSMITEEEIADYFEQLEEKISQILPPKGKNWATWRKQRSAKKPPKPF